MATVMPRWVQASVELACAIVIVAGIVFCGYVVDRYTHATPLMRDPEHVHMPTTGVWFCVGGSLGNAC